jgi:hypothetical protein
VGIGYIIDVQNVQTNSLQKDNKMSDAKMTITKERMREEVGHWICDWDYEEFVEDAEGDVVAYVLCALERMLKEVGKSLEDNNFSDDFDRDGAVDERRLLVELIAGCAEYPEIIVSEVAKWVKIEKECKKTYEAEEERYDAMWKDELRRERVAMYGIGAMNE